jgi:hypothetical protein
MNTDSLATQLLFTTAPVLVEQTDGKRKSGTCFFFNAEHPSNPNFHITLLITNYHVIKDGKRGIVQMFKMGEDNLPKTKDKLNIEFDSQFLSSVFIDEALDLAAFPIAPLLNLASNSGSPIFFRATDKSVLPTTEIVDDLSAIEEIIFIGYPSGIVDSVTGFPIIRKGITATPIWSDFQGRKQYLIDAGVFPGSSGSPVFIYNQGTYSSGSDVILGTRVFLVGIISETMLRKEESGRVFLGLGRVINTSAFSSFIESIQARANKGEA